jgi:hypothetical protein
MIKVLAVFIITAGYTGHYHVITPFFRILRVIYSDYA